MSDEQQLIAAEQDPDERPLNAWEEPWDRPEALDEVSVYELMRELHDRLVVASEEDDTVESGTPRGNAFAFNIHNIRTSLQSVRAEGAGFTYEDLGLMPPVVATEEEPTDEHG